MCFVYIGDYYDKLMDSALRRCLRIYSLLVIDLEASQNDSECTSYIYVPTMSSGSDLEYFHFFNHQL